MTEIEAQELWRGDFGKEMHKAVCAYCLPIFWQGRDSNGEWSIRSSGSGFILNCGAESFVVTAAHVYEGYLDSKKNGPLRAWLGEIPFRMDENVIDYAGSKVLDIATFRISPGEINATGKNVLTGSQSVWPPSRVAVGMGALFAGYPGNQRIESGSDECNFGLYSAFTPVSSTSSRHFGCAFDRAMWIDTIGKGLPEEGCNIGGISGCPVLGVDESPSKVLSWHLAGVGYSASNGLTEIFFAHHADLINADGTLNRALL